MIYLNFSSLYLISIVNYLEQPRKREPWKNYSAHFIRAKRQSEKAESHGKGAFLRLRENSWWTATTGVTSWQLQVQICID